MPFAGSHAAPEVENAIAQHVRGMNASRYIPETLEMYREASIRNRVYIFNVGPWAHVRELGSDGRFVIPACPAGAEYSEPIIINGAFEQPYPINEAECKMLVEKGTDVAFQILGEGPHVSPNSSFRPFGVFISSTEKPSKADLDAARAKLVQKYVELVAEASDAFAMGSDAARNTIRPDWHFVAARALKKTEAECPWLGNTQVPKERQNCPGCGEVYTVGILRHSCGWFFDKKKWEANQETGKG